MTTETASLQNLAKAHGVHADFYDLHGAHHPASPETLRALLGALGVDASTDSLISETWAQHCADQTSRILAAEHVVQAGQIAALPVSNPCDWVLESEHGAEVAQGRAETAATLPALDVGYYRFHATTAKQTQTARVLVRPARAPDIHSQTGRENCWGMTGALYGLRSADNGGLGNFADLGVACDAAGQAGAQFFGINPVHALGWAADDMISPYSPTHRGFLNIDHIATGKGLGPTPDAALIDYAAFRSAHRATLEAEYKAHLRAKDGAFERWSETEGDTLQVFAQFEAISETYGHDFRRWPSKLQTPGAAAAKAAGKRAGFHAWLQWRADTQIAAAQRDACGSGMSLGLYLDLAVGPRPGGAEVWMNQPTIAKGVTIGAPPDHLSPAGQSWALAAHAPGPLAATFYAPLRAMLRKLMSSCGLLRIDHALGLRRSFWLPDDGSPGGYISQPFETLLAIIAIEAQRAGCVIVGEDLGLVPDGFREQMNAAGLYSYSVWQFEADHEGRLRPPSTLAPKSLACFGTHDTPTLHGFWYGRDVEWWQHVGWLGDDAAKTRHATRARQRQSLRGLCDIGPMASASAIGRAIQHRLAQAPCAMLAVQLDDALGLTEAQNLPGTIDEHPNWRRRLPIPVDRLAGMNEIQDINDMMPEKRTA